MVDRALAHYGILGQKWYVRRYQNPDGSLTSAGKARYLKSDGSLTRAGKRRVKKYGSLISTAKSTGDPKDSKNRSLEEARKKIKDLSDDDLRKLNNRLELEKKYYDLTKDDIDRGAEIVTKLANTAKSVASIATIAKSSKTFYDSVTSIKDTHKQRKENKKNGGSKTSINTDKLKTDSESIKEIILDTLKENLK